MKHTQVKELLLQSLEAELGGLHIYETAIGCAVQPELAREWQGYLDETRAHVATVHALCEQLGIDPDGESPGRAVVRHMGDALIAAMEMAQEAGNPMAAQLVACECVVLAETKDHADWELIGKLGTHGTGEAAAILLKAYQEAGPQEDTHLRRSRSWCRELWMESLGLPSLVPPRETAHQFT